MCCPLDSFENELAAIQLTDSEQYMHDALSLANRCFGMQYTLSFAMPEGYALAFGLTQDEAQTVYVNRSCDLTDIEASFYFLHELRHAIQYRNPALFSPMVTKSLEYTFQYDGKVFYKANGEWKCHQLQGAPDYLSELYLASPCEVDANAFACKHAERLFPAASLEDLRRLWMPRYTFFKPEDAESVYSQIIAEITSTTQQ